MRGRRAETRAGRSRACCRSDGLARDRTRRSVASSRAMKSARWLLGEILAALDAEARQHAGAVFEALRVEQLLDRLLHVVGDGRAPSALTGAAGAVVDGAGRRARRSRGRRRRGPPGAACSGPWSRVLLPAVPLAPACSRPVRRRAGPCCSLRACAARAAARRRAPLRVFSRLALRAATPALRVTILPSATIASSTLLNVSVLAPPCFPPPVMNQYKPNCLLCKQLN
jgi:hypothetical protein